MKRDHEQRLVGTPTEIIQRIDAYPNLGVEEIVFFLPDLPSGYSMKLIAGEVLPHF